MEPNVKIRLSFVLIVLLIATNFLWGFYYYMLYKRCAETSSMVKASDINDKVVDFTGMFINDVLKAKGEIDFDTRLKLENSVRALDDKDILAQWGKFVNSKNENDAQDQVKDLLGMLVAKIKTNPH